MSQADWLLTGIFIFALVCVIIVVVWLIIRTYRHKAATGKEDLTGRVAVVRQDLNPRGVVMVEGELWNAISRSGPVSAGQEVVISEVRGLTLLVNNKTKE